MAFDTLHHALPLMTQLRACATQYSTSCLGEYPEISVGPQYIPWTTAMKDGGTWNLCHQSLNAL